MGIHKEIQREDGVGRVIKVVFTLGTMRGNVRHDVWLEPTSQETLREFLAALPRPRPYVALSSERWPVVLAQEALGLPGKIWEQLLHTVTAASFVPQPKPEVQRLNLSRPDHEQAAASSQETAELRAEIEDGCGAFGIIVHGAIVSYATFRSSSPMGSVIAGAWTRPDQRGKGYAKAVVTAATAELLKGQDRCHYDVSAENEPSVRICRSLGYEIIGRRYQCGHFAGVPPEGSGQPTGACDGAPAAPDPHVRPKTIDPQDV